MSFYPHKKIDFYLNIPLYVVIYFQQAITLYCVKQTVTQKTPVLILHTSLHTRDPTPHRFDHRNNTLRFSGVPRNFVRAGGFNKFS